MRAAQVLLKCPTPIPLEKQRNSFSDFENTTLFAHRRRNAEDSSTPDARFRQRRRIRRRGEGMRRAGILRSVYVRTHDARNNCKIRPEICPNMRACADFLECFTPIPLEKQRNSFSNFENTPAFRAPSAQYGKFARVPDAPDFGSEGAFSARHGHAGNLRSGHVRARDNREIPPKSAPICALRRCF